MTASLLNLEPGYLLFTVGLPASNQTRPHTHTHMHGRPLGLLHIQWTPHTFQHAGNSQWIRKVNVLIQVVRFPEGHHGSLRKKTTRWKSMTSEKRDNYFFGQNGQKMKLKLSGFDFFFFFLFPKLLRPRWKGIVIKSFWGFKEKKNPRSASAFLCNLGNIDAIW